MSNNAELVQLIADGKIYLGPYGSEMPDSANFVPDGSYTEIGYYSEDGFELSPNPGDDTEFTAHNGDIVDTDQLPGFWTFAFGGLEVKKVVIESYFDTTVAPDGSFEVDKASVDTYRSLIGIGISKAGDQIVYGCPRVKVSDRESVTHNRTTLRTHGLTFRTFKDPTLGYQFKAFDSLLGGVPTIVSALPSAAAATETVTITGTGFTGATAVKFAASNATSFVVVSDTEITAVMPTGSAGSAAVKVTNAAGDSTPYAYTRGA